MKTPEGHEKTEIGRFLAKVGAFYFFPHMGTYGRSGIPDIVGCIGGTFFAIEVKAEGRPLTKLQDRRMLEVLRAGGMAFWGPAAKVIPEFCDWYHKTFKRKLDIDMPELLRQTDNVVSA